jgi:4-alpha-glucanotransferase
MTSDRTNQLPSQAKLSIAKSAVGVEHLVLQIHDASFPAEPDEDIGRGSPYSNGTARFLEWAADLGFDAIQLGPRGMTSRDNPSPYDATIFSRNPLNLPFHKYVSQGRLSRAAWDALRRTLPAPKDGVSPYPLVFHAVQGALSQVIESASESDWSAAKHFLSEHKAWIVSDALYGLLCDEYGNRSWREWNRTPQERLDQRLFCPR